MKNQNLQIVLLVVAAIGLGACRKQTLRERIDTLLPAAGIRSEDVTVVIRTGGTSEIVAVRRMLEEQFHGRVEGHDPFTSVACGLAIANYFGASCRLG